MQMWPWKKPALIQHIAILIIVMFFHFRPFSLFLDDSSREEKWPIFTPNTFKDWTQHKQPQKEDNIGEKAKQNIFIAFFQL
ncbi:Uncharacterized protein APZ42_022894 [Daphnia magna]|uniref:Uncharacterized protein n=1 Tax=Daphnia magna TaxID=35525 RepID=A0A164VVJ3_9CRUS|nr:Uncharacterized protein APZ42_022894 [Daphnia magna]